MLRLAASRFVDVRDPIQIAYDSDRGAGHGDSCLSGPQQVDGWIFGVSIEEVRAALFIDRLNRSILACAGSTSVPVGADLDRMAATMIAAIGQHVADAGLPRREQWARQGYRWKA